MQLGLWRVEGDYDAAGRFGQAIDREEDNWLLYYLQAGENEGGGRSRPERTFERNASTPEMSQGRFEGCG
jgi:hypothetical protein